MQRILPRGTRAPQGHLERQGTNGWGVGRWEEGEDKGGHRGGAGAAEGASSDAASEKRLEVGRRRRRRGGEGEH